MNIIYKKTGGNPIVLHAPGFTATNFGKAKLYLKFNPTWRTMFKLWDRTAKRQVDFGKEVTILTINNGAMPGILERSLDKIGVPYVVGGHGVTPWKNRYKLEIFSELLKQVKTPFVMGLDSYDVLVLDSPAKAVERFKELDCDMLFNGEKSFYPTYEPSEIEYVSEKWRLFQMDHAHGDFKYLNAGAWIGRTLFCTEFFNAAQQKDVKSLIESSQLPPHSGFQLTEDGEQVVVQWMYFENYPRVQIDHHNKIFLTLKDVAWFPELRILSRLSEGRLSDFIVFARSVVKYYFLVLLNATRPFRGFIGLRQNQISRLKNRLSFRQ
jgi:hypothetical protein